jgi:outer membrane lipoprotein-sorting protein
MSTGEGKPREFLGAFYEICAEEFMKGLTMVKYLFTCVIALAFLQSTPCCPQDQLTKILEGIKKNYGTLSGLTVNYEREIVTKSMAMLGDAVKSDVAAGRLHFMPPYFLKVQQETPNQEILTTDGKTLWWYIPQKNLVHRYPTERLGPELRLLSDVFRGLKGVEEGFVVSLKEEEAASSLKLELTPNPPWPDITHIDLYVTPQDYRIERVEIYNILGGLTRFRLGDKIKEENFKEGFFRLEIPEGAKVVEE